jgi:two-component system chemotaxis response regulator CheB
MTSVLIADDSILIRKRITQILEQHPGIKVVGAAVNGADVVDKFKTLKPDVITLDVEMPIMNGLEALEVIVRESTIPVVMLSALTTEGADVTLKALEIGAVDFIPKPPVGDEKANAIFAKELVMKIRAAGLSKLRRHLLDRKPEDEKEREIRRSSDPKKSLDPKNCGIALGISTGGPKTLIEVIPKIPKNFPCPVFIAQHMPEGFTSSLASRLDTCSKLTVREAKNGEIAKPGVCYIAPGGKHMKIMHMTLAKGVMIRITDEPENALYKPSVDVLFSSVAKVYGRNSIGIIMTGMGKDGTRGMKSIKEQGGTSISEDKSTCVVYGMPKSIEDEGLADIIAPSYDIPHILLSIFKMER